MMTQPRSITVSPQGAPTGRGWVPMKSLVMVRTTMSTPRVMMATENSGSPTIGRIKTRSMSSPNRAATTKAIRTGGHCAHSGRPGRHRPGKSRTVAKATTRKAPSPARAPWAKLITWVALKMMTKPMARRAYMAPKLIPLTSICAKALPSAVACASTTRPVVTTDTCPRSDHRTSRSSRSASASGWRSARHPRGRAPWGSCGTSGCSRRGRTARWPR